MSPERERPKRPSKGTRKHIRRLKSQVRRELRLTQAQADSRLWNETVEILQLEIPDFDTKVAPHLAIINEFFDLRRQIREGGTVNVIDDFYRKYDKELLKELASAFIIVRRTLTPKT